MGFFSIIFTLTLSGSRASTKLRTRFNNYPLLKSDGTDVTIHNNGHTIQAGAHHAGGCTPCRRVHTIQAGAHHTGGCTPYRRVHLPDKDLATSRVD